MEGAGGETGADSQASDDPSQVYSVRILIGRLDQLRQCAA
jgi:hypothetical protein